MKENTLNEVHWCIKLDTIDVNVDMEFALTNGRWSPIQIRVWLFVKDVKSIKRRKSRFDV